MSYGNKRLRIKGRATTGRFVKLPHAVLKDPAYIGLRPAARSLLVDIAMQYNGQNNGALGACWEFLRYRGWRSKDTLHRALKELLASGLIARTRQGGLRPLRHSTYALAWLDLDPVDELEPPWSGMVGRRPGTWHRKNNGTEKDFQRYENRTIK
ncbi:MAG TPA: hypothetical protein ENJ79_02630 [Gammaproteobacteria bacterium]|nr:hypothetical protein [Gammaproteobacteria bacterium]